MGFDVGHAVDIEMRLKERWRTVNNLFRVKAVCVSDEFADRDVVCNNVASVIPKKRAVRGRRIAWFDGGDLERRVGIRGHRRE